MRVDPISPAVEFQRTKADTTPSKRRGIIRHPSGEACAERLPSKQDNVEWANIKESLYSGATPDSLYLSHVLKVNINSDKPYSLSVYTLHTMWGESFYSVVFLSETYSPGLRLRNLADKPQWTDILQCI